MLAIGSGIVVGALGNPIQHGIIRVFQRIGLTPSLHSSEVCVAKQMKTEEITDLFIRIGVIGPLLEELFFRGAIQAVILPAAISWISGDSQLANTLYGRILRVLITSSIFGAIHVQNLGVFPKAYVINQILASFIAGLGYGCVKEMYGIQSSIGAHCTDNLISLFVIAWSKTIFPKRYLRPGLFSRLCPNHSLMPVFLYKNSPLQPGGAIKKNCIC